MDLEENWRPVLGYEGLYEVSDLGSVRSLDRTVPHKRFGTWFRAGKVLSWGVPRDGYPGVTLCDGKTKTRRMVHDLVLETFVGSRPVGMWGLHHDDDRMNNRVSNLRWGTPKENHADMDRNNSRSNQYGRRVAEQEEEMRALYARGVSALSLSKVARMDRHTVAKIVGSP